MRTIPVLVRWTFALTSLLLVVTVSLGRIGNISGVQV